MSFSRSGQQLNGNNDPKVAKTVHSLAEFLQHRKVVIHREGDTWSNMHNYYRELLSGSFGGLTPCIKVELKMEVCVVCCGFCSAIQSNDD